MAVKSSIQIHKEILTKLAEDQDYTVFLCGPALTDAKKPSAVLRQKIIDELKQENFDVVLGEDDGLEDTRLNIGLNAQDNELEFIKHCNAVVILADSVGSFCELGLFSWHFIHKDGRIAKPVRPVFIVLLDALYENERSYLSEGPILSIAGVGIIKYIDYKKYDPAELSKILKSNRGIARLDKTGRPRGKK